MDVIVGDARGILIQELGRYRAGKSRFRGLRFLHTHLKGEPLSQDDLLDLALLRFDLVAAVEVLPAGLPGQVFQAHLMPGKSDDQPWEVLPPVQIHGLDTDFLDFITSLEEEYRTFQGGRSVDTRAKRALLVAVDTSRSSEAVEESMEELKALAWSAGMDILDTLIQKRAHIDGRYLVGSGKIKEIFIRSLQAGANLIIFDHELTPSQVRSISEATELEVIDRTQLILDIFASRARSREGKLQVELAQLRYSLPRLVLKDDFLSRITGGIRARGPGETKLEILHRRISDRIAHLEKEIEHLRRERDNRRRERDRTGIPVISIVGYTNAGKSTLLNSLTGSSVHVEDRLFATLDPTTRRLRFPEEREVIVTDTVGFIRDLPAELFKAFRSTLEELQEADLLIHLADTASPMIDDHIAAVDNILQDLALDNTPTVLVFNKMDLLPDARVRELCEEYGAIPISAKNRATLEVLIEAITERLWAARNPADEEDVEAAAESISQESIETFQ
jgi:GTP-binding protein HflX